jgi:MFS family permease
VTAARVRALIPATAFRAGWSSTAFLFYFGTTVVVIALLFLIEAGNGEGDDFDLFGWATLALAATALTAAFLRRAGHSVLAGLAAFVGLIVFGVWVGAFLDWIGLLPDERESTFARSTDDFDGGILLLEVLIVAAGILALCVFRFPLLVLPVAVVLWYGLVDNLSALFSAGTDGQSFLSALVGLLLVTAGVWLDRAGRAPHGLWLHVVGGLAIGVGLLELLDHGTWRWVLLGLVALAFIAAAQALARSSYAVIGAIGILTVGGHFIEEWFSIPAPFPYFFFPFYFFYSEGDGNGPEWEGFLAYVVLGLILVALGLVLERGLPRRRPAA